MQPGYSAATLILSHPLHAKCRGIWYASGRCLRRHSPVSFTRSLTHGSLGDQHYGRIAGNAR